MSDYIVYKHTCPNGKVYIGITCQSVSRRWRNGLGYKSNPHLFAAIEKYGWDNIKHEILFDSLTKDEACAKEIALIAKYKSNDRQYGYNTSTGGEYSLSGIIVSEETRAKLSALHKGKHPTEETRQKMSVAAKNMTEEHKRKISEAKKGKKFSAETCRKISEGRKGKLTSGDNPIAKKVIQLDKGGNQIKKWDCIMDAMRGTGVDFRNISACCYGKIKSAGGFVWKYAAATKTEV